MTILCHNSSHIIRLYFCLTKTSRHVKRQIHEILFYVQFVQNGEMHLQESTPRISNASS